MGHHEKLRDALSRFLYPQGIISCGEALSRSKYPEDFARCPDGYCPIAGRSFFPGGLGHIGESLPVGGVMYLGHNFGKISDLNEAAHRGFESNSTWSAITSAVIREHLEQRQVWFTNYFMGILDQNTNQGEIERTEAFPKYEKRCWEFLKLQVVQQRPALIVVLGKWAILALGAQERLGIESWQFDKRSSYGHLRLKPPFDFVFSIPKVCPHPTKLIAAYHPSFGRGDSKTAIIEQDARFAASVFQSLIQRRTLRNEFIADIPVPSGDRAQ